jgi:hypothetical protein
LRTGEAFPVGGPDLPDDEEGGMVIREVKVEYGRTVNRGNYESERLTVGYTATLDEREDVAFAVAQIYEDCREQVGGFLAASEHERRLERQRRYHTDSSLVTGDPEGD